MIVGWGEHLPSPMSRELSLVKVAEHAGRRTQEDLVAAMLGFYKQRWIDVAVILAQEIERREALDL